MERKKVSVVMSCYNHEKYVAEAIESIVNQTHENLELILVDDKSKDRSVAITKKYAKKDSRIVVLENKYNMGVSHTINRGMRQATGSYIAIQSADDVSVYNRLEQQVLYLLNNPLIKAVSTNIIPINDKSQVDEYTIQFESIFRRKNMKQAEVSEALFIGSNYICNSSQMFPMEVVQKIGYNKPSLFQLHDYDYNIRLSLEGAIHIMDEALLLYRIRDDGKNISLSNTKAMVSRQFTESYCVLNNYLSITNVDFFISIFGKYIQRLGKVREETIPYFLGMIAIQHCKEVPKKLWGYHILYSFLNKEGMFELLRKDCGLTYSQFKELGKRIEKNFTKS